MTHGGGNTYSAATKILMDVAAVCFMPLLAFGTATATAVAQSLGASKPNLAARYAWDSVRVGMLAMIPMHGLAVGRHELTVMPALRHRDPDPDAKPVTPYIIPFWR